MIILGIETSCDETAAAILEQKNGRIQILSNIIASSAELQAKYGGVFPEHAAREQVKSIIPVIQEALEIANLKESDLDALAITQGPGLMGSLLVGVETAKILAKIWDKPLIPVNHLIGHFYANWIGENVPTFPSIGLLVSGGHSDIVLFRDHGKYEYLGGTRDDAAGECFDKCARLLGLSYPGGPEISKLALLGDPNKYSLPRPLMDSKDFDFSFSGLKTFVFNFLKDTKNANLADLAAGIEQSIIDVLVNKAIRAAQTRNIDQIIVAGGVAANPKLKQTLERKCSELGFKLFIPEPKLCTDNGAMIASAAFFLSPTKDITHLEANPNLSLQD